MPLPRAVSHPAHVQGPIGATDTLILATLKHDASDEYESGLTQSGIGAFRQETLDPVWVVWDVPPLATAIGDEIYAYARSGIVVALDGLGRERWRTNVPDDRSEAARQRGDSTGPFEADVLVVGGTVHLAAGSEIFQLHRRDGRILNRHRVCSEHAAVIARLAQTGAGDIIATCTKRTRWDDEEANGGAPLQPPPPPELRRVFSGDLVVLDLELNERWRLASPIEGLAYANRQPTELSDGSIGCAAGQAPDDQQEHLDLFHGWVLVAEADSGDIRWLRESVGGYPQFDPVGVPGGILCGSFLTFLSLDDGTVRWSIPGDQCGLDPTVAPIYDPMRKRLLVRGTQDIQSIDLFTGNLALLAEAPAGLATTPLFLHNERLYLGTKEGGKGWLHAVQLR